MAQNPSGHKFSTPAIAGFITGAGLALAGAFAAAAYINHDPRSPQQKEAAATAVLAANGLSQPKERDSLVEGAGTTFLYFSYTPENKVVEAKVLCPPRKPCRLVGLQ